MIKLTDDEFLEWCGSHKVKGCGGTRLMEGCEREVSLCEDCRAAAQLKKVVGWLADNSTSCGDNGENRIIPGKYWQSLKKEVRYE